MTRPPRPYRGVSAEERRAHRRAALLEAALDLLGAAEPRPVTMTAICESAGLTERYFYESFKDRDDLLLQLIDAIALEVMDTSLAALDRGADTAEQRARASIQALVDLFLADPRKGRAALVASVAIPVLRDRRQELLAAFGRLVSERTQELYGERSWPPPEDRIGALLFVGGLAELLSGWLTGKVDAEPRTIVEAATRHYLASAHR